MGKVYDDVRPVLGDARQVVFRPIKQASGVIQESEALTTAEYEIPMPTDDNITVSGILLQAIDIDVYLTFDGSTPSSSHGFVVAAGSEERFYPIAQGTCVKVAGSASGRMEYLILA